MTDLVVDACDRRAAEYAVRHWHYLGSMPSGKVVAFGVWADGRFAGAVLFGRGSTPKIGAALDLPQTQVCELVRVAFDRHAWPASQAVSSAVRLLRARQPGLRLVVSFADAGHGHRGGLYQAMNWTYLGPMISWTLRVGADRVHPRTAVARWGTCSVAELRARGADVERVDLPAKHKYVLPLDRAMARVVRRLARPYPAAA